MTMDEKVALLRLASAEIMKSAVVYGHDTEEG